MLALGGASVEAGGSGLALACHCFPDQGAHSHVMSLPFSLPVSTSEPEAGARRAAEALPSGGALYYALGGGLGHLTRAAAIARHWTRLRPEPFVVLTNCRFTPPVDVPLLRLEEGDPEAADLAKLVRELVAALQPRVLAVDAFPAGILGELSGVLPRLPCRRVVVLRRLQDRWVEHWNLPGVLREGYDAAACVEDGAWRLAYPEGLPRLEVAPVLIRDAPELLSREEARLRLRVEEGRPALVISATGSRPPDQGLIRLGVRLGGKWGASVRVVTPFPQGSLPGTHLEHYPLLEWLRGADLVVGPSGYNLFHETESLGVPAVWVPQPRKYDDQFGRAAGRPVARSPEELEQQIGAGLRRGGVRPVCGIRNGARELAEWLATG